MPGPGVAVDIIGIDGCKGGWVVARRTIERNRFGQTRFEVATSMVDLRSGGEGRIVAAIDIPIDLSDNSSRECDRSQGVPRA